MKSFVFDKVSERTLKLTTIGPPAKDNAGPMVSCYFFNSPRLAIGTGLSKYDNGTYTKHLHKTKRHDSIFDGRIVKPCLP